MGVKSNDPRPPYLQVADDLRSAVASHRYKPGERLPSGRDLAKAYGVALMTIQRALSLLADEGIVVSYQGRGVFVSAPNGSEQAPVDLRALIRQLGDVQAAIRRLEDRVSQLERSAKRGSGRAK